MGNKIKKTKKAERFTREEWLHRALDVLAKEGPTKLRIHYLVKDMGVTTGSFYWHFKNLDDFVQSVVEYWVKYSTTLVIRKIDEAKGDIKERIYKLVKTITSKKLGKYEIAIRSLVPGNPVIERIVKKVDTQRLQFVRKLFVEAGFEGEELEARLKIFVCFFSLEYGILSRESQKERLERLRRRVDFFTRP